MSIERGSRAADAADGLMHPPLPARPAPEPVRGRSRATGSPGPATPKVVEPVTIEERLSAIEAELRAASKQRNDLRRRLLDGEALAEETRVLRAQVDDLTRRVALGAHGRGHPLRLSFSLFSL